MNRGTQKELAGPRPSPQNIKTSQMADSESDQRGEVDGPEPRIASKSPTQRRPVQLPPVQPWFNLPSALPLPPAQMVDEPTVLVTIPNNKEQKISLAIIQGNNHDEGRLSLVSAMSSGSKRKAWRVRWIPAATDFSRINELDPTDVGFFSFVENELCYVWAIDAKAIAVSAMRNSLLQTQLGEVQHISALRAPAMLPRLAINLTRRRSSAVCKCDFMPELSRIRVDIRDPSVFPTHRVEGPGFRGLKLGDVTTLRYIDADGAVTRLSIVKLGSRPAIEVETGYRLPSGFEDVATLGGTRKMQELQQELEAAKAYRNPPNQSRPTGADTVIAQLENELRASARGKGGKGLTRKHEGAIPVLFPRR